MNMNKIFPTKGNLIITKNTLSLSIKGYELLDKKRHILISEMMKLIDIAKSIRGQIEDKYKKAYLALQDANIALGLCDNISKTTPIEESVNITYYSVMGVEIPKVSIDQTPPKLHYGFANSNSQLDKAYIRFDEVKKLTVILAEVDNSIFRLTNAIKNTQRRANALKNIVIPNLKETVHMINGSLEEKDREEFSRLKIIKFNKEK